jgi:hypothetical protein
MIWRTIEMVNLDPIINEFVSGNWLTISIFLGLLKSWAVMSESNTGDKIHTLLSGLFTQIRGGGKK